MMKATAGIFAFWFVIIAQPAWSDDAPPKNGADATQSADAKAESSETSNGHADGEGGNGNGSKGNGSKGNGSKGNGGKDKPSAPEHVALLKDSERIEGLIPLYQKDNHVYAELSASQYGDEFIVLISIARGIGQQPLYGGMTWGFGDDWVWSFRKVDKRIHVVRKNVRFKAKAGTPAATALKYAYTDSVLFSLPIITDGPKGGDLVDLNGVFMTDLPQISEFLSGFVFSANKSTWAVPKGFQDNVELEIAATYASSGRTEIDSVADSRGATINVHYSISKLPQTGYKSRYADNRVGYFLTVRKDYSKNGKQDRFVRYINRWDLQKADEAENSPPKKPIIFWLENTIPYKYRQTIREGILEWNKAFDKAGFANAVEVRQQPDKADWDPEDINYNTFRWITSSAGFAMGPSRVNPYTGQILDADILFDADFLEFWKSEYELFTPKSIAAMTGGPLDLVGIESSEGNHFKASDSQLRACQRPQAMSRQLAFGSVALSALRKPTSSADEQKMILQGLKATVMHEVGHTLGLRHNFKGSTKFTLEQLNDPEIVKGEGMLSSVMDYDAVNIVPSDQDQGNYFTGTIGSYDIWAIEYGYKSFSGGTNGERDELEKIASRSGEPGLNYATDEDTRMIDPDPLTNRHDLGKDPMLFARRQVELVQDLMPGLVDRMTDDGDDYTKARRAFNVLLSTHGHALYFVSRFVGGLEASRSHKGDKDAPLPFEVICAAKQRAAIRVLNKYVFGDEPFQIPAETYNQLGASRWWHWGTDLLPRTDYPIHDAILMWQSRILDQLLSPITLTRIHDSELKVPADEEVFAAADLIEDLTGGIFAELDDLSEGDYTNRHPAISSLRRNVQREFMKRLGRLALGHSSAPEDCQTVAYSQLTLLEKKMTVSLKGKAKLDSYSRSHLEESSARIRKVLEAKISLFGI